MQLPYGGYEGYSWMWPINSRSISSPFGYRYHPKTGEWSMHNGIDMPYAKGSPVYATRGGTVTMKEYHRTAGNYLIINHEPLEDKPKVTYQSRYLHLDSYHDIKVGDHVKQGQLLGYVGSTGRSTGPHLHFSIRKQGIEVDPKLYLYGTDTTVLEDFVNPWEHRQKDLPKYDNWSPLYGEGTLVTREGTSEGLYKRRQHILSEYSVTALQGNVVNERVCGGYSDIGLFVNANGPQVDISKVEKQNVINEYYSPATGYRNNELPKNIKNHDTGPWLVVGSYIAKYLSEKGWKSSTAICALLGNIGAECGMNPARWECNKLPNNVATYPGGFGLIQWTPVSDYTHVFDLQKLNDTKNFVEGGPYDIDTQLNCIVSEFTTGGYYIIKKGESLERYLRSIYNTTSSEWQEWNCSQDKVTETISKYIDANKFFNIDGGDFGNSDLPVEVLTIAYAVNRERPDAGEWDPQKRIGYAQTFMKLLFPEGTLNAFVSYTDPTQPPCDDYNECEELWKSKDQSKQNINPYPTVKGSCCVLPSNNAYCWGIAHANRISEEPIRLADSKSKDWFDYNKDNNIYEYGNVPRANCIACWTYKNYDPTDIKQERSCVGYVTDVLGSEVIKISWIKHKPTGYTKNDEINSAHNGSSDEDRVITNYDNNWGMEFDKYVFRGFIYPQKIKDSAAHIISESSTICVEANSSTLPYNSLTFSINDCKHHNKIRIVYDVEICAPMSTKDELNFNLYDYCNRYITFSQQVYNTNTLPKDFSTILPSFKKGDDGRDIFFLPNPFPTGHILLSDSLSGRLNFELKHVDNKDIYRIENVDETFNLFSYTKNGTKLPVFNDSYSFKQGGTNSSDGDIYFERTLPGYITIIPRSLVRKKDGKDYHSSISIHIKNITLYK